jgi:hypothetical protein
MNSGVERMAKRLAYPTYNPHEVHYTRERTITDGYEQIETTSKGESRDHLGKTRKDERTGMSFRPIQRVIVDTYYKTPQLHEADYCRDLTTSLPGERLTGDLQGVRKEKVQMLGEPWPFGLSKKRTEEAIARLQNSPLLTQVNSQEGKKKVSEKAASNVFSQDTNNTPAPWMTSKTSSPPTTEPNSTWRKRRKGKKSSS